MTKEDLDLTSTEDLWKAICRRHDAVVIVLAQDPTERKEGHSTWFYGGQQRALGLLVMAQDDIVQRVRSR